MGKARSFRLTKENEARLENLIKTMDLDNANRTFNAIIENYHLYEKNRDKLAHFDALVKAITQTGTSS